MMFRSALFLVLCLQVFTLSAQNKPEKMMGLLWEISGKGLAKPGYLYGTMHVSEKLVFNLSDTFFIGLRNVDMVALETDHDEWQEFTDNINGDSEEDIFSFRPDFGGRRNYQNLYNESFKFAAPESEMLGAILSSKPMMTNEFLYRSNTYRQEYEEDTYLDLFIFQAGRKLGKKVIGLETIEGSYEAAIRAQIPDDEEKKTNNYYRGYYDPSKMEEAYRNQDLSLLDSLNKLVSPGKNFQRWMLDERNIIMADRIDSIMQSGTSLFSAVGAAHLPGEMGVILLLRKKGYTVRSVKFTTANGNKDKELIEKIRYPVKLSQQWSVDSLWSADAPGKFWPTANYRGFEQHLCADMNNGAFYAVYRMATNGWWTGQTPAYIADRLDSLIYEKIPGKIQDRKRLDAPFPGHEITTRTRRGDVQRYKIFVTPFEVLMFTIGGNGDYALGEEAERFLGSIRFSDRITAVKQAPTTLRPSHGGFKITFPASMLANTTEDKKAYPFLAAAMDPADSAFYFLYRTDYHDWGFIEEDTFELNIIGEKIAEQFTKTAPQMQLVAESPYPTQDVSFRSERDSAMMYYIRLVVNGPHYYMLGCRKKTPGAPAQFFKSFAIEPTHYPEGWKETADTTLDFRVQVLPAPEKPRKAYLEKLKKIMEEGWRKRNRLDGEGDEDFGYNWGMNGSRVLKSKLTGEEVSVRSSEFFAGNSAPTRDSFEIDMKNSLTREGKLALKESRWETSGDTMLIGHFLLEDTNSTRGIRAKVIVAGKRMYTLTSTVNLKAPESEFVRTVFSSFVPTDSVMKPLCFGERNISFLQKIYAPDTLASNAALAELRKSWSVKFKPEDFPAVKAAVEHPKFGSLKFVDRQTLLNAIGKTQSPAAVPWLRDFYRNNQDSARHQAIVLQSLANLQTKESFKTLLDLWLEQPVYLRSSKSQLLYNFYDTLELTAKIFPDMLKLADIETNRDEVYGLMSVLVKKGLVKPKMYAHLKPALLRETAWYLSQTQVGEEEKRASKNGNYNRYDYYDYEGGNSGGAVERNFNLLAPFLKKDAEVRNLVERAIRYGDKPTQLLAYGLYLQNDIPVAPEKLKPFSEDDKTRYAFFMQLAKVKKLRQYSAWFSDTTALARAYVMQSAERRGVDSIRFISKHKTVSNNKPATLYFFDIKGKDEKEWGLASATMPKDFGYLIKEDDDKNVHGNIQSYEYYDGDYGYGNGPSRLIMPELHGNEKEEFMRKKIGETRFANRERYVSESMGGRRYYYEDY